MSQQLKSVQSLMDHLLEENIISQKEYDIIRNCTTVKQQTGQLIDLVLSKGNAAAEVFRNWIKKNDVCLLRELMAQTNEAASPSQDLSDLPMEERLRRLQEERTCKVCMDKEVNIVFIPCGHLVVCKEYAPKNTSLSFFPSGSMMEGRPVTLTCSTDAKPAVLNFTWYKETGSQLELLQTGFTHTYVVSNPTHSTRYRCTAQNQHGQHNATIELDAQYTT
ncbi:unnamed protein product [Leuciscus chuanchicus]